MQEGMLHRMLEVEEEHWWFSARLEILLSLLHRWIPAGGRLLDIGCGTGYLLDAARAQWEVWGIDPAPEAVEFCRSRGLDRVCLDTMERLDPSSFPRFDAVCFFDVLEHLDDDVAALRTARRLLNDSGVVIATVPAYGWLWSSHDVKNHHRRRYTRARFQAALREAGLSPLVIGYFNSKLFPLALVDRGIKKLMPHDERQLLPIPPRLINGWLRRVLLSEKGRVTGQPPRPYKFGLSLVNVAGIAPSAVLPSATGD